MIILIGGEKGGTGKTTLSTHLGLLRIIAGGDVLIVDTDKQGSASSWSSIRSSNQYNPYVPVIQKFGDSIPTDIKNLNKRYKDIIIDAGGRDSVELRGAMIIADIIYIPVQASQFDVWTLGSMDDIVGKSKIFNKNLRAYIVVNRVSPNPAVSEMEEIKQIKDEFKNLELAKSFVRDRISFRKAAKQGLIVNELVSPDKKAITEITNLYKECFNEQ